jgi:hypothetical protein
MIEDKGTPRLIQCGDHGWAPWGVVCVHLVNGTAAQWCRVPGRDYDRLCPACLVKGPDLPVEYLKAVCLHCIRQMQGEDCGAWPPAGEKGGGR